MKALILAAGYATRLYPMTREVPKALLPLGPGTILDHIVRKVERVSGISEIVLVSNHRFASAFRAWAESRECSVPVRVLDDGSTHEGNRLGAVGDMAFAVKEMGMEEDLLVMAGDNVFTFELQEYVDFYHKRQRDCILVQPMERKEDLQRVGVVQLDEGDTVLSFEEKPAHPRTNLGVLAVYIYRKDTLPLIGEYLNEGNQPDAPGYFPEWLCQRKEMAAYRARGTSYDIGTPEAYREVTENYAVLFGN